MRSEDRACFTTAPEALACLLPRDFTCAYDRGDVGLGLLVCGGSKQQLGPNQWPGHRSTLPAQSALRAEQRESKLVGKVGVCAKAMQQRTRLVSTIRCHDPGLAHNFGLNPWIAHC
jgi:hypothetical protein